MKIAMMLGTFQESLDRGDYSGEALLDTLTAAGGSGLEPTWSWLQGDPARVQNFLRAAAARRFFYPCLDIDADLASGDPQRNRAILERCAAAFAFCRDELGCPLALLYGSTPPPGLSNAEARQLYGEMLNRCAELAAAYGMTVCIEDFGVTPHFTASVHHCLEVIKHARHPALRLNFDNGNVLLADEDPLEALELFRPLIAHVHIKDFARRDPADSSSRLCSRQGALYKNCPLGAGVAAVSACIQRLQACGCQAWLSAEIVGPSLQIISRDVAFIRSALTPPTPL